MLDRMRVRPPQCLLAIATFPVKSPLPKLRRTHAVGCGADRPGLHSLLLDGVNLPAEFAFAASSLRPPRAHPTSSGRTLPA